MKIEPINNHAYLLEVKETMTQSGIVLSQESKSGTFIVHEIADNELNLKPGMKVIASRYTGEEVEVKIDGKQVLLKVVPIDSISAIVHD